MNKKLQIDTIKKVIQALEKQKNKEDADGSTHQIDTKRYISQERFQVEKKVLFDDHPIITGAAMQLTNSGDYYLFDLASVPILSHYEKSEITQ